MTERPKIVLAGQGEVLRLGAAEVHVLLQADDTGRRCTVVEERLPPGPDSPPLHVHSAMDHLFFVIEGTVRFVAGQDEHEVGAGGLVFVPRGVAHTFANASGTASARFLELDTPGGFEAYFRQLSTLIDEDGYSVDRVRQLQAAHDTWRPSATRC